MREQIKVQPIQPQPTRKGRRSIILAVFLLLLCIAGIVSAIFYLRSRQKPRPTVFGWHALVNTFAGSGSPGFQDGPISGARFANVFGVAVDGAGNVYVSDAGDNNRIRKITPEGTISTLAGGVEGFADGQGASASFNTPSGIALDPKGFLYLADTGNNSIRKISPEGQVTTVAGDGSAGYLDGPGRSARFNGPIGLALDQQGNIFVADTYNDRIRKITPDGQVSTIAGSGSPGYQDGPAALAQFDTPCAVAVTTDKALYIADTGNNRLRKLTLDGQVSTFNINLPNEAEAPGFINGPMGLAQTHDNFLYVTENRRGRVLQIAPDGRAQLLAGSTSGFANGDGLSSLFNNPSGIALGPQGSLYVADTANYLVRKLVPSNEPHGPVQSQDNYQLPKLDAGVLQLSELPWPVDPQRQWHEVVATMGEVRGSFQGESRDHLHSGIDVQGNYGTTVRAIYDEKVSSPLPNWGFGDLNEGLRVSLITYIHMRVGRNQQDGPLDTNHFIILQDEQGKPFRVRIKRGTRFHTGDPLGTINRMYHVHLNFGPGGAEVNPLSLPFIDFSDHVEPTIEREGIQLLDQSGQPLKAKQAGRLLLHGDVSIVVDAYDQVDHNQARRRLGLYKLGFQVLNSDGTPAKNFEQPRFNIEFNRLPSNPDAVKIAYADNSGITVYGSATTRFLYNLTNTVRDGIATTGIWHTSELPPGDYTLRIIALDYAGNEARTNRDLLIRLQ